MCIRDRNIGGWHVYNVRDMHYMFHWASAFDQDLSAWETSGVTNMHQMFSWASSFDQDIGGWSVENVRDMHYMFHSASAYDQDLGWCVDDGVFDPDGYGFSIEDAFSGTPCASTSCGVVQMDNCPITGYAMDGDSIRTAVAAWFADQSAAEATYGHISTWATGGVTDMSYLFEGASSFNEDIGAWDTSGVTAMNYMFHYLSLIHI